MQTLTSDQDWLAQQAGFAHELADAARAIVAEAFPKSRRPDTKSDLSPVTETDRRIETALRERILDRFPGHGILGEEFAATGLDQEYVWVIDPIDGTKAFVGGLAVFGTLIALTRGGVPVLGVIDNPTTGDRWIGLEARPTTLNGRAIRSRPCAGLPGALISNGGPESFDAKAQAGFQRLRADVAWCVYGGSCMAYGRVADGSLDVCLDAGLDPFDYCALVPVLAGAGAVISDWQGRPLGLHSGTALCAATGDPTLHDRVLARLNGH
ncbi:MAG: inositol monophosphatase family protein [Paracoccus sp. (in: a-proteobacteria)]|uniref:inositol monophosphatase family protein n=1 Tax=Paracoccus sp. TaxID=267 RepID=UPI0039E3EFAC